MSAKIEITLEKLKLPIAGMGQIDILVDGAIVTSLSLGDSVSLTIPAGKHTMQTVLHGVVKRISKELTISVDENSTTKILGKYSRMWGNMKLKQF